MKAFVLAAGQARRLYPLTKDLPKCLLAVGDRTLLERQIAQLHASGVDDITVVTGHYAEKVKARLPRSVTCVYTPYFAATADIVSLWTVRRRMTGPFLWLHADVLMSDDVLPRLLAARADDVCLAVERKSCEEEDEKVRLVGDRVMKIGKAIPLPEAEGEFIGVARVAAPAALTMRRALESIVDGGDLEVQCTEAVQRLIDEGHPVNACFVDGLPWLEVDFLEDFERAAGRAHLFP